MKTQKNGKTILVVDDNLAILKMYSMALKIHRFKVLEANSGYEGLATLTNHYVDMVITDWEMPRMDGLELLHNIREKHELRHLPVLMISGSETSCAVKRAHELGVCGWLEKPFTFKRLVSVINDALKEN